MPNFLHAVDADTDGMDDAWETSMGLNPSDPLDAFQDKDGDRVPNLWEYNRGTDADDNLSVPPFDATVDSTQPTNATLNRYATLQEAYDSLPDAATDPNYRAIVKVLRGLHGAALDGSGDPKKVAWLGELGGHRMSGREGAILTGRINSNGLLLTDDAVLDGLIIEDDWYDGTYFGPEDTEPAVKVQPAVGLSYVPEVRLVNCIIRFWDIDPSTGSYGGALYNAGADVWLIHTTIWASSCSEWDPMSSTTYWYGLVDNGGTLHLINSIIWDGWSGAWSGIYTAAPSTVVSSIAHGVSGATDSDPELTFGGYLRDVSDQCLGMGTSAGVGHDLQGETRPISSGIDIGADQWVNTDSDTMADWWELFWFGNLAQVDSGNPYGPLNNGQDYLSHMIANGDQDADGLPDWWETTPLTYNPWADPTPPHAGYWSGIAEQDGTGNPDGDLLANAQEFAHSLNPTVSDPDTDGDRMTDAWETAMGLNPSDPLDAFKDKDNDRAPNIWEHDRGTKANTGVSKPAIDATVDSTQPTNATLKRYATLQEAYDALPSSTSYRAVIRVLRGYHSAVLTGVGNPKKVLWVGDFGAEKSTALEGPIIEGGTFTSGLVVTDETFFNGLIFEKSYISRPAILVDPDPIYSAVSTEVRLISCIIRYWEIYDNTGNLGGALVNDGGDVSLIHCTVFYASSQDFGTGTYHGSIENRSGTLKVFNSIIWDPQSTTTDGIAGNLPTSVVTSIIQGGTGGGIDTDPELSSIGSLTSTSTACLAIGSNQSVQLDLRMQFRGASGIDLGAEEWTNTDADNLPDWWEQFYFGNLTEGDAGDPDADLVPNLTEFVYGAFPVIDQEPDGLADLWEIGYFPHVSSQIASGNPDGDMATNYQESLFGTDPTFYDSDWDADGWVDADEWTWFGTYAQNLQTDFDGDGLSNGLEDTLGTDMFDPDENGDGILDGSAYYSGLSPNSTDPDGDGWSTATELANGTNPHVADTDGDGVNDSTDPFPLDATVSSVPPGANIAGPPVISVVAPPGAVLVP